MPSNAAARAFDAAADSLLAGVGNPLTAADGQQCVCHSQLRRQARAERFGRVYEAHEIPLADAVFGRVGRGQRDLDLEHGYEQTPPLRIACVHVNRAAGAD